MSSWQVEITRSTRAGRRCASALLHRDRPNPASETGAVSLVVKMFHLGKLESFFFCLESSLANPWSSSEQFYNLDQPYVNLRDFIGRQGMNRSKYYENHKSAT